MERVGREGVEIGLITHTEENVSRPCSHECIAQFTAHTQVKYYERYGFRVRETMTDTIRGVPVYYWSMSKP
jgi:hypothetical protein